MATLYDIDTRIEEVFKAAIDPETGEIVSPEALNALDDLELERSEKIDNIICFIKNSKSDAAAYKAEADRQKKRYEAAMRKAESLTKYLAMHVEEGKKFSNAHGEITWRKSVSVDVPDVMALPEEYRRAEWKADKKSIGDVLKKGGEVSGASLVEKKNMIVR